mmetsp:Transcript_2206/g.4719  ORF Transcript_2206/g.4719 Transcript_2206/m.4719 type:complete len:312 (-) Transcript_2206:977-1912(-)|eukprot:CAMPEP_0194316770 /NCGR_PEP_ID=MMETSP0171-20130528/13541_1 /TAXON_ID=218684 /ORGANISM="Corethron pennatum, Strain L29A3" /LENGTH=311 /DNA_ID=CAMNT_0039073131 /DNA_START=87 /DNA_END=1022 /DNA_ORIENTATION=+
MIFRRLSHLRPTFGQPFARRISALATVPTPPAARPPSVRHRPLPTALRFFSGSGGPYENILTETRGRVVILTLDRPKALNALNGALMDDVTGALRACDADPDVGCVVLTGGDRVFAAGADIKQMSDRDAVGCYADDMFAHWGDVAKTRKPIIAAVNGYALGGGCELAMMCDIIIAGDKAIFGQPEINLGVIPGAGGTQRLVRAVGKSKAMEMCLTGTMIQADQAERDGLISKVVPAEDLLDEAVKMATTIASKGQISVMMAKEAVNAAYELNLAEGLRLERRMFHSLFATHDQKEGMQAFGEKRQPSFKNR